MEAEKEPEVDIRLEMKPHHLLAFCAFVDAAIQFYSIRHGVFSITGFIGLFIAPALLWRDKFSFKAYRFYLWVTFLVTLFFSLRFMFGWTNIPIVRGSLGSDLHIPPILGCLIWMVISGILLYYTETDKVRRAFRLPPKKAKHNTDNDALTESSATTE